MRISDNRYSRDRFRFDLALRFIRHEARTHTIRAWTGLSDDRIRKLYRTYMQEPGKVVSRPRGKSPQQSALFTRSPSLNEESSLLASLCRQLGVLTVTGTTASRRAVADISRGERLCQAFEVYRDVVAEPRISFENLVFLVSALTTGDELTLASCEYCGVHAVVDRMALKPRDCPHCAT